MSLPLIVPHCFCSEWSDSNTYLPGTADTCETIYGRFHRKLARNAWPSQRDSSPSTEHLARYDPRRDGCFVGKCVFVPYRRGHLRCISMRCATRACGAPVHFQAHPSMTRITPIWAGNCRWTHRAQAFKKIAIRLRSDVEFTRIDLRIHSREHAIVTRGMSSMH